MNKLTSGIIISALVIVAFSIYWFGVRPTWVRSDCWENANDGAENMLSAEMKAELSGVSITKGDSEKFKEKLFKECLLPHGLAR